MRTTQWSGGVSPLDLGNVDCERLGSVSSTVHKVGMRNGISLAMLAV